MPLPIDTLLRMKVSPVPAHIMLGSEVAIARALANDPEVILADEPTGNLDSKTGRKVIEFLEKLNNEGKTIIMVTHDATLAQEHADVVYWLRDGKLEKITRKRKTGGK